MNPYLQGILHNITIRLVAVEKQIGALERKEWVGLTDVEIDDALWKNECNYLPDIIRIVEAKLKEKNK